MKALRFHYSLGRLAATRIASFFTHRAYFSALSPLRLEEIPTPELPRPDWVRVRPRLTGICGSDLKQVLLKGDMDNPLTALLSFPHVLGHESVGVIEEVGPAVKARRVGERIALNPWTSCAPRGIQPLCPACQEGDYALCHNFNHGGLPPSLHLGNSSFAPGAHSESYICHESQCFPVPEGVPDEAAVLSDPFSVSLHMILRNPPLEGAPTLVYGIGMLGLMAIAILKHLYPGTEIYAVGRYPHQVRLAKELGAREVLPEDRQELILGVARLTGGEPLKPWRGLPWLMHGGVGTVYDAVGSPGSIEAALRLVRPRGKVVVSGVEAPRRYEWTPLYFKEIEVIGSNAFAFEPFRGQKRHAIEIYLELAQQGFDLSRLVTHHFKLEAWREAFWTLMNKRQTGAVKVVFDFR